MDAFGLAVIHQQFSRSHENKYHTVNVRERMMTPSLTLQRSTLITIIVVLSFAFSSGIQAAPADKCEPWPSCKNGDDPSTDTDIQFHVEVVTDPLILNYWSPHPGICAAYTVPGDTNFRARFARHLQCVPDCWLYLDEIDDYLTDDISLNLTINKGVIKGFGITGQDTIGREGIMHESDIVTLNIPVPENPELGFEVPIDSDVVIHRLSGHLAGRRVLIAGAVHVGKLVYTPCGGELECPSTWPVEYPDCPEG
jgi:hypothetical protein